MLVRRIARPLLATIFISGGIDAIRNPKGKAAAAGPVIDLIDEHAVQPAAQKVAAGAAGAVDDAADLATEAASIAPEVGDDERDVVAATAWSASDAVHEVARQGIDLQDETYVRANGAIQVVGGVLLATGRAPRLASAVLAASLVPTTLAGHRFWELEGDERQAQQLHFLKNVSLLGGLVLAAADTEGRPGLAWRARHLRHDAGAAAAVTSANVKLASKLAKADAKAAQRLAAANAKALGKGGKLGVEVVGDHAATGARSARRQAKALRKHAKVAAKQAKVAGKQARAHAKVAGTHARKAGQQALDTGHQARERADALTPQVQALSSQARDQAAALAPQVQALGHSARELAMELAPQVQALGHSAVDQAVALGHQARDKASELAPQVQAVGQRVSAALPTT